MRSVWTESLQGEHSGVNRLNVNNSIFDIKERERKNCSGLKAAAAAAAAAVPRRQTVKEDVVKDC